MKKINIGLAVMVVLFVIFEFAGSGLARGQQGFPSDAATIKPADFSKHEELLLKAGGATNVFAFEYHLPNANMKYLDFWVEVYKNGKDQGRRLGASSLISGTKDGLLLLTVQRSDLNKGSKVKWVQTIVSDRGSSRSVQIGEAEPFTGGRLTSKNGSAKINPGETITLAVTLQDPGGTFSIPG
ncbi:MAG TPA: hypothetical protein VF199_03040, partial [Bacillales bacterium]